MAVRDSPASLKALPALPLAMQQQARSMGITESDNRTGRGLSNVSA